MAADKIVRRSLGGVDAADQKACSPFRCCGDGSAESPLPRQSVPRPAHRRPRCAAADPSADLDARAAGAGWRQGGAVRGTHQHRGVPMTRKPPVDVGSLYAMTTDPRSRWRVDKLLADDVHVVLVCCDEPSRRKTLSTWALLHGRDFAPAPSMPEARSIVKAH
jgi:hypothetical protein